MFKHAFEEARNNPGVVALAGVGFAKGIYEVFVKPNPAIVAWGATLGVAFGYDAWAVITGHETMSHAYHRGMEHPIGKFLCIGALGTLAVHLAHKTSEG